MHYILSVAINFVNFLDIAQKGYSNLFLGTLV